MVKDCEKGVFYAGINLNIRGYSWFVLFDRGATKSSSVVVGIKDRISLMILQP